MIDAHLPPSDLGRLRDEVLCQRPEAALPSRLSDYWLQLISRDLGVVLEDDDDEPEGPAAAPLALILHILSSKATHSRFAISVPELQRYLADYRIEVALELLRRRTPLDIDPATLDTIFTNRDVTVGELSQLRPA